MSLAGRAARREPGRLWAPSWAVGCLALVACSSGAAPGRDAGTGGAAAPPPDVQANETTASEEDGGEDLFVGTKPEVPAADISCNQIRICASSCTSTDCVDACVRRGTAAAKTLFQQWASCVSPLCSDVGDITCRCEASCFGGSDCEEQTGACAGDEVDYVCDELCH